ncbi:MAG: glutamine synthetase III [Peptoniphilus lacydonensis]|uniref:glutamine synthetase III n=1 Tax=Peptoniphilus lacydonensis TaxID=1673725 RepID=UPI0008D91915|nr:glutamine synthetase III [Peptoniphilus lacydonensis]MDU2116069.1 glutamine synthetase III [Peptoniphilus lacydonensis]MDU7303257.1 glutamine synthetase III [Peptoniphilus lacydonensis]
MIEEFGIKSFNKKKMKENLPYPVYLKWKEALRNEKDLDRETADAIAHAMKDWALKNGATHFAHWFLPLSGHTAKKHEAFITRTSDGEPINRFSGKELVKGEPDASSFPSGGMRSTFEARGYTYWDLTANSFIIGNVLYIPTIFMSYKGEKLDKRGPLIDSIKILSDEGVKIVNIFRKDEYAYRMRVKVGLEQEFFLVDKEIYKRRSDLKNIGRTIVGAPSPKGQELSDHYFGQIPARVEKFYKDVDEKLYGLGIYSEAEHNEVAPNQFEMAILFENVNVAIDDNQLLMNILKETALENNLVCLFHEKPFANVNGSGKHNNYSIVTNYGLNVFDPGDDPYNNNIFLLFVSALIEATDKYQDLLRVSASSTSNDFRLGADEAPPAIISLFLGSDLEELFKDIKEERHYKKEDDNIFTGYNLLSVPKDSSDRNRTAAVAFTGNKFEFRMLGSSKTGSDLNITLNCAIADSLANMYEKLKPYIGDEKKLREKTLQIVRDTMRSHDRIICDGDNYSDEWKEEAKKRGLSNHKTYFDALVSLKDFDYTDIFLKRKIYTEKEINASYEVNLEKVVIYHTLEAKIMIDMIDKDILPEGISELKDISHVLSFKNNELISKKYDKIDSMISKLIKCQEDLNILIEHSKKIEDIYKKAEYVENNIAAKLLETRKVADNMEKLISRKNITLPSYEDIFNSLS